MANSTQPGTVTVEKRGPVAVVHLLGEHDIATAADLRDALQAQIDADAALVVSVADTEFIDSTVVSALFDAGAQLSAKGRPLVLHVNTSSIVKRVFEVVDFTAVAVVTESMDTAVSAAGERLLPGQGRGGR